MGTLGNIIMFLVPLLFYAFVFLCLREAKVFEYVRSIKKREWCVSCVIVSFMAIVLVVLVSENEFVYFWDYGREWKTAYSLIEALEADVWAAIKGIYHSINSEDYNRFMPLLVTFPMKVLGNSFEVYVISNHIIYMCPAIILFSLFGYACIKKINTKCVDFWKVVLIFSSTPILYYVELDGFMDPPVLILIICVLFLSLELDYRSFSMYKASLIAICLLLLVLFRRHFAYWVVGYVVSQFVNFAFQFFENKDVAEKKHIILGYIKNMFFIGCTCLVVLLVFFRGFLVQSVFNNFSVAYKAYDVPLESKLERVVEVFGVGVLCVAFLVPLVRATKDKVVRKMYMVHAVNIVVTTILLWRVLQMNYHQYYLIVVQVMLLAVIGIEVLAVRDKHKWKKIIVPVFCGINLLLFIKPMPQISPFDKVFTQRNYEKKYRSDMKELESLVCKINDLIQDGNTGVYVLSSSGILNSHTLLYALMPETDRAIQSLYDTHNVDLRDGFPTPFLNADIIVVGTPTQLHLPADTQRIVSYLAEQVADSNTYIGEHYKQIDDYKLDGDVTASIYLKESELTREDYEKLREYYNQFYSDYPEYFADRIVYPEPFFPTDAGEEKVLYIGSGELISDYIDGISDRQGTLVYGPAKKIEKGKYTVKFEYEYTGDEEIIGSVDVYMGGNAWAQQAVYGNQTQVVIEDVVVDSDYMDAQFRMFVNYEGVKFIRMTVIRK